MSEELVTKTENAVIPEHLPAEVKSALPTVPQGLWTEIASIQTFDNSVLEEYKLMSPKLLEVKLGDEKGMKTLHKTILALTKLRTSSEKEHKLVKDKFLRVTQTMDLMKRKVAEVIEKVQQPLIDHETELIKEQEDIEKATAKAAEDRWKNMQKRLSEHSFGTNGTDWSLIDGDKEYARYDIPDLINMSDEVFEALIKRHLPDHQAIVDRRAEAKRLAEEATAAKVAAEAETARLAAEALTNAKANEAALLAAQQQIINARRATALSIPHVREVFQGTGLHIQEIGMSAEIIAGDEQLFNQTLASMRARSHQLVEQDAIATIKSSREATLVALGMTKTSDVFSYNGSPLVKESNIPNYSEEDWNNKVIAGVKGMIAKLDANAKLISDQELQKLALEQAASAPDKEKAEALALILSRIQWPEAATETYRRKFADARGTISDIITILNS